MSGVTSDKPDSDDQLSPAGEIDRTLAMEGSTPQPAPTSGGEQATPRRVGEYEILSEIARGGMGVVYRARHQQLNRTVALKMILRGQFASEDDVRRFYQEAEAAARLDHAGIVPIYEIGEHEGHHFFAMKLIEGGSLAQRLPTLRRDMRESMELLAKVARAVHHAHQRGILHRDIKPENILIDERSSEPLLTDLGLARQVEQDSNITKSGVVVGTPAYMPPEQAAGQELTTAADIYSLGAILYEVLTGQPPFREATPVATLMKVLNEAPARPSEVIAKLDRGLEAICLKCVDREPDQRYSSAAELADDLEAWLSGSTLSVRPPSLGSALQSWFVYNLRSVGGALLVGCGFGVVMTVLIYYLGVAPQMIDVAQLYDGMPDVSRPALAFEVPFARILEGLGESGAAVVFLPLCIASGFVNALIVRPGSRAAAIAAGLVAGLGAIVVGFVGIIGWLSTIGIVVSPVQQDIRWLANMALDEREERRDEVRRQLLFKYPDLREMTPQSRAGAVSSLIHAEQVTAIPWALAAGMLVVVGVFAVPILVGTIVAGRLLNEKRGFWAMVFGYLEPLGVLSLLGVLLGLTVLGPLAGSGGYMPPPTYTAWLLITFSVATWGSIVRWTMTGRLLAHMAWVGALMFLFVELRDKEQSRNLADDLVYQSQFAAAAERLERHVRWKPNDFAERILLCLVLDRMGDDDRFRKHMSELVQMCGTSNIADAHQWGARVSLLRDPTSRDVRLAVELAESATRPGTPDPNGWCRLALALARYHEGKREEALQVAELCLQSTDVYCVGCARAVRLRTLRDLDRAVEAEEEEGLLTEHLREHATDFQLAPGTPWPHLLYFEALHDAARRAPNTTGKGAANEFTPSAVRDALIEFIRQNPAEFIGNPDPDEMAALAPSPAKRSSSRVVMTPGRTASSLPSVSCAGIPAGSSRCFRNQSALHCAHTSIAFGPSAPHSTPRRR